MLGQCRSTIENSSASFENIYASSETVSSLSFISKILEKIVAIGCKLI